MNFVSLDFETVFIVSKTVLEFVHPHLSTSNVLELIASVTTYDLWGAAGDSGGSHLGPHACWTRTVPTEPYSQFLIFKVRIQTYRFPRGIFTNVCIHALFPEFLPTSRWLSFFSQFSSRYTQSVTSSVSIAVKISSFLLRILIEMHVGLYYGASIP